MACRLLICLNIALRCFAPFGITRSTRRNSTFLTLMDTFMNETYHARKAKESSGRAEGCCCCVLVNDPRIVRWNMSKHYLKEAAAAGVPTIPTLSGSQPIVREFWWNRSRMIKTLRIPTRMLLSPISKMKSKLCVRPTLF